MLAGRCNDMKTKIKNGKVNFRDRGVAESVLKGAKMSDVSRMYGIKDCKCRELIHKFCRNQNKLIYEEINIEAAHRNLQSPSLNMLRNNKEHFINIMVSRAPEDIVNDILSSINLIKEFDLKLRAERVNLADLRSQLASIDCNI